MRAVEKRAKRIRTAVDEEFELCIIGGGVHGVLAAQHASRIGLKTLLLEAHDYAFGTSSRSSKLLHGGLRYLQYGEFRLVFESLKERAYALAAAPHLARWQKLLIPTETRLNPIPRWKAKAGLTLYDLLARESKKHEVLAKDSEWAQSLRALGLGFGDLFGYFDAQMDDARIVVETAIDARRLGAVVLNYARVESVVRKGGKWRVSWIDKASGETFLSKTLFLINASGPWVPELHGTFLPWLSNWPKPIYSRGSHLLFAKPWKLPGVLLPTQTPGRNYWVLPFNRGEQTLVGTTDVALAENEADPKASPQEIEELLALIKGDFPESGLSNPYQTFAGVRILALKPGRFGKFTNFNSSAISRDEVILELPGYAALLGGKYTNARKSALRLIRCAVYSLSGKNLTELPVRVLPGGENYSPQIHEELTKRLVEFFGLSGEEASYARLAVSNFGSRAERLLNPSSVGSGLEGLIRQQIEFVVQSEDAISIEDIFRRRLGLALVPGFGLTFLRTTIEVLQAETAKTKEELEAEMSKYRAIH